MYKLCLTVALVVVVAGCVPFPVEPQISATENPSEIGTAQSFNGPVKVVNMAELPGENHCENLTRTGSRIVVAKRCYTARDLNDREAAMAQQMEQVRRDQDELDRRARDREEQRRRPGGL